MSGSPEELLRSALEKVIFFECRVASLEHELDSMRAALVRARDETATARRRERELEAALAQARGEQSTAVDRCSELTERVRLLEAERERLLSGMVESARVAGAPSAEGGAPGSEVDLAGFIAELRAEIEQLRAWKRESEAAGASVGEAPRDSARVHEPPAPVGELAQRFEEAGRISLSRAEVRALSSFSTRSERALYEASLDDLASTDPAARRRAADGLRALGSRGAAPLIAAALGREQDANVKTSLLAALGALGESSAVDLAARELSDPRPAVRAAALEAVGALLGDRAVPHLATALGDESALVRRRAVMLLGLTAGASPEEALTSALGDRDAGVARAAAAALAGRPTARAQGALARALDHREPAVRKAAARAVVRWSGEAVDAVAPEPTRRTAARRIAEKLLAVSDAELRNAVTRLPADVAAPRPSTPAKTIPVDRPVSPRERTGIATSCSAVVRSERAVPPRVAAPPVAVSQPAAQPRASVATGSLTVDPSIGESALAEVRTALRGRTLDELAGAIARDRAEVEVALRVLVARGQLVARGPRFFTS